MFFFRNLSSAATRRNGSTRRPPGKEDEEVEDGGLEMVLERMPVAAETAAAIADWDLRREEWKFRMLLMLVMVVLVREKSARRQREHINDDEGTAVLSRMER
jgi:hypothetical protein